MAPQHLQARQLECSVGPWHALYVILLPQIHKVVGAAQHWAGSVSARYTVYSGTGQDPWVPRAWQGHLGMGQDPWVPDTWLSHHCMGQDP